MDTKVYRVEGMTCCNCVKHVEKALRAVPNVGEVVVDRSSGTATISGDAPFGALAAEVAEAGYRLIEA